MRNYPHTGIPATLSVAMAVAGIVVLPARGDDSQLRAEAKSLLGTITAPADAQREAPDAVLGRALFWDARLSADGKTACASCHLPEDGGADRRRFSPDAKGQLTSRNSQTVFNAMGQASLRWLGDRKSGAQQAEKSLTGSMGFAAPEAAERRLAELGYEPLFRAAYPHHAPSVSAANYGRALQAYQATLVTPAPFDRFLAGHDAALTPPQKAGLQIFLKIGCADCHDGPLMGGGSFQKFGVVQDYWLVTHSEKPDVGRYSITQKDSDRHTFRVQMLRNVARTAPYFHDGSVEQLPAAVHVMAQVQLGESLSDQDAMAVAAFLEALSGEVPKHFAPPTTTPAVDRNTGGTP